MSVNTLIATLGGQSQSSPMEKLIKARQIKAAEQRNALADEQQRLTMGLARKKYEQDEQKRQMEVAASYMKDVAYAPPAQQAELYEQRRAMLMQDEGIPSPDFNPQQVQVLVDRVYGTREAERINALYNDEIVPALKTKEGHLLSTMNGERMPTATIAPKITEQAEAGRYTGPLKDTNKDKIMAERLEADKLIHRHVSGIDKLTQLVSSDNFRGGTLGDVSASVNSAFAQFNQAIGNDTVLDENGRIDPDEFDLKNEKLSELTKSAIVQGTYDAALIQMAYLKAKMVDPQSKITDKDFEFAKRMLAAGGDKRVILSILQEERDKSIKEYNVGETLTSRHYPGFYPKPRFFSEESYRQAFGVEEPVVADQKRISSQASKDLQDLGIDY